MAQFGLPGGWELGVILVTILVLFVPGILVFGAGFFLGKKAGEKQAQADSPGRSLPDARPTDEAAPQATDGKTRKDAGPDAPGQTSEIDGDTNV